MKIKIKHKITNDVIYEYDCENNTIKIKENGNLERRIRI